MWFALRRQSPVIGGDTAGDRDLVLMFGNFFLLLLLVPATKDISVQCSEEFKSLWQNLESGSRGPTWLLPLCSSAGFFTRTRAQNCTTTPSAARVVMGITYLKHRHSNYSDLCLVRIWFSSKLQKWKMEENSKFFSVSNKQQDVKTLRNSNEPDGTNHFNKGGTVEPSPPPNKKLLLEIILLPKNSRDATLASILVCFAEKQTNDSTGSCP